MAILFGPKKARVYNMKKIEDRTEIRGIPWRSKVDSAYDAKAR